MKATEFVSRLQRRGVEFHVKGSRLAVDAPRGLLTEADRDFLAARKREVIRVLASGEQTPSAELQPGVWVEWESPLFGRCVGQVAMTPESGWLVVRAHSVTGDLALIHVDWNVRVCERNENGE